jgi:hypothetical protein
MQAIQVYLDSSDFSDLSLPRVSKDQALADLRCGLLTLVEKRIIEVRISLVHLVEIGPLNTASTAHALERAEAISSICSNKALLSLDRLDVLEMAKLLRPFDIRIPKFPKYAFDDTGDWLPDISGSDRQKIIESMFLNIDESEHPRHVRRTLRRKIVRNGYLTQLGVDYLKREWLSIMDRLTPGYAKGYPEANFVAFMQGKLSAEALATAYKSRFMEPHAHVTTEPIVSPWLRNLGEEITQQELAAQRPEAADMADFKRELARDVRSRGEYLEGLFERQVLQLRQYGIGKSDLRKIKLSPMGSLPRLDTVVEVAKAHTFDLASSTRKSKRSDTGDVYHAGYIPYVDIFRADAYMAQLLAPFGDKWGTRIVARSQLLQAIETEAEQRST